jgi:hypothetical protein
MLVGQPLGENLGRRRPAGQRSLRATGCARYKREACARERPREGLPILRPVREPGSTTGVGSIELPGVPAPPECATGISQRSPVLLWKIFKAEFFCGIVLSLARAGFLSLARFSLSLSRQHSLTRF